jgi:RimJ/RimL family protein N-acetyltransferase
MGTPPTERSPHHPPERIELAQLVLRRVQESDAEMVADSVAANVDWLADWMPWARTSTTLEFQQQRIPVVITNWDLGVSYEYAVVDLRTGGHLGTFSLERRIGPDAIELGYWLIQAASGHGHASAAASALTDAGLALPDVGRVEIHCDQANTRSQRVAQRIGYRLDRIEDDEIQTPSEIGRSMIWIYQQTCR